MSNETTIEVIEWPAPKLTRGTKIILGLVLATGLLYVNSLGASFIFDDWQFAANDGGIRLHWNDPGLPNRVFGTWTLRMNHELGGQYPWGYRLVNIAIHMLAGVTLFAIVRRTLQLPGMASRLAERAEWIAGAAALLWLVHPLQVQAVTYIVQRYESLMALGFLLALYCLIRGAQSGTPQRAFPTARWWYAASFVAFAFGAASKEVIVAGPVLLLLFDRAFLTSDWRATFQRRWGFYLALLVPVAWLVWTARGSFAAEADVAAGFGMQSMTPWEYLRSQPAVLLHYLRLCVWPDRLILDYGWPVERSPLAIYGLGGVIVLLVGLSLWGIYRAPRLGFLGMAFFLILAPTSSIMPIKDLAFEHRMYLPLAAVVVLVVLAAERLLSLIPRPQAQGAIAAGLMFVAAGGLGMRTMLRNLDYHRPIAIWEQCIANNPTHARPYRVLATLHADEGHDLAEQYYAKAVQYAPRDYKLWIDFGNFYMLGNELKQAGDMYRRAAEVEPRDNLALLNLGRVEMKAGNFKAAIDASRQALARKPSEPRSIKQVAWILATADDNGVRNGAEAVAMLEALPQDSRRIDVAYMEALSAAYAEAGQFDRAVATARVALQEAQRQRSRRLPEYEERVRMYEAGEPYRQRKVNASLAKNS